MLTSSEITCARTDHLCFINLCSYNSLDPPDLKLSRGNHPACTYDALCTLMHDLYTTFPSSRCLNFADVSQQFTYQSFTSFTPLLMLQGLCVVWLTGPSSHEHRNSHSSHSQAWLGTFTSWVWKHLSSELPGQMAGWHCLTGRQADHRLLWATF